MDSACNEYEGDIGVAVVQEEPLYNKINTVKYLHIWVMRDIVEVCQMKDMRRLYIYWMFHKILHHL